MACVLPNQKQAALDACGRQNPLDVAALARCIAGVTVCADTAPTIDPNLNPINLLGVYRTCNPQPTILALYPPPTPLPNEAAAQAQVERMREQVGQRSTEELKLISRAHLARRISLRPGFYVGLGLCGLGAAALFLTRR